MDAGYVRAKHMRSLGVIRSGVFACLRCGGSGIYHTHGKCFRCDGSGVDPRPPKDIGKSKRWKQQQEWAAQFGADGMPLPRICPFCEHVIDHCVVRVCVSHQRERSCDEIGVAR